MLESRVLVTAKEGLHARPAAELVSKAQRYKCKVTIESAGRVADAKSILQVLSLGAGYGQESVIRTDGEDEDEALPSLISTVGEAKVE